MAARSRGRPLLFPGYLFVLIELQWHTARWAPGVVRLVMNGVGPAAVPEGVIMALKARETGGLIDLPRPPKFRPGDRLRVMHGPFAGHVGLYAGMKPRERVEVLLAILGGSQRVTLAADAVEQASVNSAPEIGTGIGTGRLRAWAGIRRDGGVEDGAPSAW